MRLPRSVFLTVMILVAVAAVVAWKCSVHIRTQPAATTDTGSTPGAAETGPDALLSRTRSLAEGPGMLAGLLELRRALLAMPAGMATAWVQARLHASDDFPTGLDFSPTGGDTLSAWPSLRVFLLDLLLTLDPAVAAQAGRDILHTPASADEWAVAMRNIARGSASTEDTALLQAKFREMLHRADWRRQPSSGYLQSFDVIVYTRDTALTPELLTATADLQNKAVRHAAFLALDRLVQVEPAKMLEVLAAGDSTSGVMVSNMIARADVRDAAQRAAVERWLSDERRTAAELQGFTGVFPNANQMVSHNLLTATPVPDGSARAAQDRAALSVVDEWLADPRLARAHDLLRATRERLREFTGAP